MPTPQRSLTGHPGATFFRAEISPHQFFNFFTSSGRNNPHQKSEVGARSHPSYPPTRTRSTKPQTKTFPDSFPAPPLAWGESGIDGVTPVAYIRGYPVPSIPILPNCVTCAHDLLRANNQAPTLSASTKRFPVVGSHDFAMIHCSAPHFSKSPIVNVVGVSVGVKGNGAPSQNNKRSIVTGT
jgi:hypothetical protein